ncbi:MAG: 4Fe-4S dicluster domain-containing protein [Desulfitobacterium sp.]
MAKKMGFVINTKRCVGCKTCTVSCKMENTVAAGLARIRVLDGHQAEVFDKPTGTYPNVKLEFLPIPCQHCDKAPCVPVCPTGASQKREDGIVFVDMEKCIGCGKCVAACPYGSRQMDKERNKVDKCTLCMHRLDEGKAPMCVLCCPGRAIIYGDLNDANSEVAKSVSGQSVKQIKVDQGTGPAAYYILP